MSRGTTWDWMQSEIPLYKGLLRVAVCRDLSSCEELGVHLNANAVASVDTDPDGVVVAAFTENGCNYSVIAHEAYHVTMRIAGDCGLSIGNYEHMAYLHQWVFTEISSLVFRMKDTVFAPEAT